MERSAIRDHSNSAPDFAEPVITARAQLRSSRGAHSRDPLARPGYAAPEASAFCARDHRCRRLIASLPVAFLLCHITVVAAANRPDERSDIRDHSHIAPDIAALIRATR
jgi:hypothetical protein